MANIKEVRHQGKTFDIQDKVARDSIGDLSTLETTKKGNLVEAINEARQSGGGSGTVSNDYSSATNKPKINGVELNGNKTTKDLNISYNDLTDIPSGSSTGDINTDEFILPTKTINLWDGTYKQGKLNYNTGEIDTTVASYYAEIELEQNTDYVLYSSGLYVLYPEDMTYSKKNYLNSGYVPVTFNSGTFKYIRFWVHSKPTNNAHLLNKYFLIKGTEVPYNITEYKDKYFVPTDLKDKSFYRSVPYKLQDLTNPFKPTAVAMAGDSITQGVHSANHDDIVNCYAKLFGDYILDRFNNKIYNIPLYDERVEHYGKSTYYSGETGLVLGPDGYVKMDFYGSYISVGTYNGAKPDVTISIYIDDELFDTFNFATNDSTKWENETLTMGYHTIKVTGNTTLGYIGVKKYVTFANRGVSGKTSTFIRDSFANTHLFDNDDIIFCMIGTNDRSGINHGLYDYNIRQVFKHGAEAMGKQVVLMSATPVPREYYPADNPVSAINLETKMKDIVAWVNGIGGKENEQVISFYNWLIDYAQEVQRPLDEFFNDGLHPTEECYRLMFEHLVRECGWGIDTITVSTTEE